MNPKPTPSPVDLAERLRREGVHDVECIVPDADPDERLLPDMATLKPVPWARAPHFPAIHDGVEMSGERSGERCPFAPQV